MEIEKNCATSSTIFQIKKKKKIVPYKKTKFVDLQKYLNIPWLFSSNILYFEII